MSMLLDAIKSAIQKAEASGTTRYRIAKETGISQAALSLFVNGERGMGVDMVERLADFLELEIIIRPKSRRKGR